LLDVNSNIKSGLPGYSLKSSVSGFSYHWLSST
jgi:hypothetical protein